MNFDETGVRAERASGDLTFVIGGVTLRHRPSVEPELMAEWEDAPLDLTSDQAIEIVDKVIIGFIHPDDHELWEHVRQPGREHPVTYGDMLEVMRYLIATQAGRPTTAPSASTDGRESSDLPSMDASVSPEATPAGSTSEAS